MNLEVMRYVFIFKRLPAALEELKSLREFYDPDTVELMNWIKYVSSFNPCFSSYLSVCSYF